jgi:hypothetical protein
LNENLLGLSDCSHSDDIGLICDAYCPDNSTKGLLGIYNWTEREAEDVQRLPCAYMGTTTQGSCNISQTHAARRCNEYGRWEEPDLTYCVSEVTANLCFIREMEITAAANSLMALWNELIAANDPADRSSQNLETVDLLFQRVAMNDSISVDNETLMTATEIISVIQSWGNNETTRQILQQYSANIVGYYEEMSEKFANSGSLFSGPLRVGTPGVTFHGENFNDTVKEEGVKISVSISKSGELETTATSANASREIEEEAFISLPPSLFQLFPDNDSFSLAFTTFNTSVLLPQAPESRVNESIRVASHVIGATLLGYDIQNLTNITISITLRLANPDSQTVSCVVWDKTAAGTV